MKERTAWLAEAMYNSVFKPQESERVCVLITNQQMWKSLHLPYGEEISCCVCHEALPRKSGRARRRCLLPWRGRREMMLVGCKLKVSESFDISLFSLSLCFSLQSTLNDRERWVACPAVHGKMHARRDYLKSKIRQEILRWLFLAGKVLAAV